MFDLLLTNGSKDDLVEVELKITLIRTDGQKVVTQYSWQQWTEGEVKKINVKSHPYQVVKLEGKAYRFSHRLRKGETEPHTAIEEVQIDDAWTWTWGSKH